MTRTIIVAVAGFLVTVFLLSIGTYIAVWTTSSGQMVSGQSPMPADPWLAVRGWHYTTLLFVSLPTVLVVGFLVGLLAKRYQLLAAVLATSPVSVMAFGWDWRDALVAGGLVLCAVGTAYLPIWQRSRSETRRGWPR